MNNLKKKLAAREGFTLVELIVVIAILGILAGIAVQAYSGYISKANEASDLTQLDAVKTAAVFAYTDASIKADPTADITIGDIKVTTTNAEITKVEVGSTDVTDGVKDLIGSGDSNTLPKLKSDTYKTGALWSSTNESWGKLTGTGG